MSTPVLVQGTKKLLIGQWVEPNPGHCFEGIYAAYRMFDGQAGGKGVFLF